MYKYHSVGISHTSPWSLMHTQTCNHILTPRHSEERISETLVTVAALPMIGKQMRAKARDLGSIFSCANNACQGGPERLSFTMGRCCSEHKEKAAGSNTERSGEDWDVFEEQVVINTSVCLWVHGLHLPATYSGIFNGVRVRITAVESTEFVFYFILFFYVFIFSDLFTFKHVHYHIKCGWQNHLSKAKYIRVLCKKNVKNYWSFICKKNNKSMVIFLCWLW